jgi:hypothetical protein
MSSLKNIVTFVVITFAVVIVTVIVTTNTVVIVFNITFVFTTIIIFKKLALPYVGPAWS